MTDKRWRKSTRSGTQTNCVELPHTLDAIRDSKNPGTTLATPHLPTFLHHIKTTTPTP